MIRKIPESARMKNRIERRAEALGATKDHIRSPAFEFFDQFLHRAARTMSRRAMRDQARLLSPGNRRATSLPPLGFKSMLPKAEATWTIFEAAHLLNRAGFGGSPSEIKAFHSLGREKAVDSLIAPTEPMSAFPIPAWSTRREAGGRNEGASPTISRRPEVPCEGLSPEKAKARREARKAIQQDNRQHALEGQGWWFRRMLKTEAPLREKMTLFWHDHFATSIQKVKQPVLMMIQNELFRRHAFGSFKELTQAIVRTRR